MDTNALELTLPPDWAAVKAVWEPCRSMLEEAGLGPDEAYAISMVAQELLENAVKYGAFGPGEAVRIRVRVERDDVTVEVASRLGVDDAHLRVFDRTVQWIRSFQDPFEAYVERLKQVSSEPYAHGKSGLGLTRIAYEGRCVLDFYVDSGNTLAVSAVYRREGETA
ncbi:ATP-binding protein [Anaeromyxobacter oryzae]|uniref:ATP-binding protein n=1 Tax=Anaeromyxobacter oryzae TaxID=2918170 RepID=UPI0020BE9280|nr:ATP-binding protein [Anaeromyxobacter oryzae]